MWMKQVCSNIRLQWKMLKYQKVLNSVSTGGSGKVHYLRGYLFIPEISCGVTVWSICQLVEPENVAKCKVSQKLTKMAYMYIVNAIGAK